MLKHDFYSTPKNLLLNWTNFFSSVFFLNFVIKQLMINHWNENVLFYFGFTRSIVLVSVNNSSNFCWNFNQKLHARLLASTDAETWKLRSKLSSFQPQYWKCLNAWIPVSNATICGNNCFRTNISCGYMYITTLRYFSHGSRNKFNKNEIYKRLQHILY